MKQTVKEKLHPINIHVVLFKSNFAKIVASICLFYALSWQTASAHFKNVAQSDSSEVLHPATPENRTAVRLIPEPVYLHRSEGSEASGVACDLDRGFVLQFSGQTAHDSKGKNEKKALKAWKAMIEGQLKEALGNPGKNETAAKNTGRKNRTEAAIPIRLELNPQLVLPHVATDKEYHAQEAEEGYRLKVTGGSVQITARTRNGLYYGVQSLLQLIATDKGHQVPTLEIEDIPQYSWRGFMLDVSRHFYTVEEIKKLLDVMSRYKLNVFHWHLTDDQGWRLQIKRYPKLTSVGAWRQEIPGSVFFNKRADTLKGKPYRYGGFYTQEQAREIVRYGALRGITVVPEIELPGHSEAALAAYPAYSSTGRPQTVANSLGFPKGAVSEYNPGNPETFTFLENILDEVMDIFPSRYIHVGADEVDKSNWKKNASCQALMKKEGLSDYEQLQSYFINKIGSYLKQHGRNILCWDEALEGNLMPSATITYWRSWAKKAPLKAVSAGHPFINVCSDPLYLNRYQAGPEGEPLAAPHSMNTLERVYQYQMMPSGLTPAQQKLVLGGQAAIWTEFFSTNSGMEYMLLPRLLALAENLWSAEKVKNYSAFYGALPRELNVLGQAGYNYRRLDK